MGLRTAGPAPLPWSLLLTFWLRTRFVSGICDVRRHLNSDGYTFKFTLSIRLHAPDSVAVSILTSSTGAFELKRETTNYLKITVFTDSNAEGGQVTTSNTWLSSAAWFEVTVEKHLDQLCIQVGQLAITCANNAMGSSQMKEVGELVAGTDGVEVKDFAQVGTAHAEMYLTSGSQLFHYVLVGIEDGTTGAYDPARDDYADVSDPTLGRYVKPKFGTFTRLRYDCGYQLAGTLGVTEINGTWTWDAIANGGLLYTEADPVTLVSNNVVREPNLPGYVGHAHPAAYWSNYNNNFHPSFGLGSWSAVDSRYHATNIFACEPSRAADIFPPDWTRWTASPNGGGDTNRFVRIWLGQEVEAGTVTTTTTGTCTTTTTSTTSTSVSSSTTGTTSTTSLTTVTTSTSRTMSVTASTTTGTTATTSTSTMSTTTLTTSATTSRTGTTRTISSTTSLTTSITSTSATSTMTSMTSITTSITGTTSITSTSTATTSITSTRTATTSITSTSTTRTSTISTSTTRTGTSMTSSTTSVSATGTSSTTSGTSTATVDQGDVLTWISGEAETLVELMLSNPDTTVKTLQLPGAVMTAVWTSGYQDLSFRVEGTDARATLPGALFARLGEERLIVVATVVHPDLAAKVSGQPAVAAAIELSLYNPHRHKVSVERVDREERVVLTLPVNRSSDSSCGYWDESKGFYSNRGMEEVFMDQGEGEQLLMCSSTHLTFFAAVLDGFLNAFACAQLGLLSSYAIQQMLKMDWLFEPVAIAFWVFELTLVLLMAVACFLDWRRERSGVWEDEFFLIPTGKAKGAEEEEGKGGGGGEGKGAEAEEVTAAPTTAKSGLQRLRLAVCAVVSCILMPFAWFFQSSACRDALDDICSRWFAYFGEVRSCIEDTCSSFQCSNGGWGIIVGATTALLHSTTQRQVSASLSLSEDAVSFYVEDEDLHELLTEATTVSSRLQSADRQPTRWERRQLAWLKQHERIVREFDHHWSRTHWSRLPMVFLRLILVANPLTAPFLHCIFMKSSQRFLMFVVEISGELMMMTVFYEASAPIAGQEAEPECVNTEKSIGQEIGRILAIVVASELFGAVPVMILESLHARSFKKFEFEGCPEWKRQLRAWRFQDRVIWVLGLAYTLFCSFFVALFLGNVHPTETFTWGFAGGLSFVEDTVIIPFAVSLLLPIIATLALALACCISGVSLRDFLRERRVALAANGGNWTPLQEQDEASKKDADTEEQLSPCNPWLMDLGVI